MASALCTSSVASRIHSSLQKLSPKIMHMLFHERNTIGTLFKVPHTCESNKHPTSKDDMSTMHHQLEYKARACQPCSTGRLPSYPIGWRRALIPPNLCQNPKTNILRTPRPAKGLNGILCGCSNLEHAVGVQQWECGSHPLPPPRRESSVSFGILLYIFHCRRRGPVDEFPKQFFFNGTTKLGDC